MKKVLSLFLAIMMIFGALSVGASAIETSQWHGEGAPADYDQAVFVFYLNGGTLRDANYVYNEKTGNLDWTEGASIKERYVMVPSSACPMRLDDAVTLPAVVPPSGYAFDGWYDVAEKKVCPAIIGGYEIGTEDVGKVVEFRAVYSPAQPEEDTMAKIMGILIKIFGTIVGLLFFDGDTELGQTELNRLFGDLFA